MNRFHAVANGDYNIEVVGNDVFFLEFAFHGAMHGGMCKFCTYHFSLKFAFLENVGDMLCDYGSLAPE